MCTIDNPSHKSLLYTKATKRKGDEIGCIKRLFSPENIPIMHLISQRHGLPAGQRDPVVLPSVGKQQEKKSICQETIANSTFEEVTINHRECWNSSSDLICYFHLSKLAGINIFQYNKHSLFLLFGFQSCIWELISIFH